jgi:hypothetical protein
MIRTASLVTLGLALTLAAVGCEKKVDSRKDDVPVTGSSGTGKGKSKSIEAGVQYPPK